MGVKMKEKIEQFLNTVNSIKDTASSLGWLVSYPEGKHINFFVETRFQIENIQVDFVYSALSIKSIKLTLMYGELEGLEIIEKVLNQFVNNKVTKAGVLNVCDSFGIE